MDDSALLTGVPIDVQLAEPLLTADQVSELLAVPRSSIYEYARRRHGALPSIAVGRHVRFYRSDIEAWLTQQRSAAPPGPREQRMPRRPAVRRRDD